MKKVRILSIDGGGIRGILPGTILTYVEDEIKRKTKNKNATIGQYFDFIAGTSTGGILSLIYLCPDTKGKHRFSAKEAVDLYLDRGDEIFDVSFKKRLQSMGGLNDEKYDAKEIEEALQVYFGDLKLNEVLKPCLITSYDLRNRQAHFFTSADAQNDIFNYYVRDVARATSAAPTYFEPVRIQSIFGTPHTLIDGGVFANNPSLCAYAEVRNLNFAEILKNPDKPDKPGAKDMLLVSIGTGSIKEPYYYKEYKDAGMVKWIKPLIDIMMSGNSETVDYQLRQIFNTLSGKNKEDYYRIQPILKDAKNEMDDASLKNLKALHQDGLSSVVHFKNQLDEIVEKLIQNH